MEPGDDPRLEAKIWRDNHASYPWLELTDQGLGCSDCMAFRKAGGKIGAGKNYFVKGTWKQNPKYSFSGQVIAEHLESKVHKDCKDWKKTEESL